MLIAFVHKGKAFLPEISAYIHFFTSRGIQCEVTHSLKKLYKLKPRVVWHFMGVDWLKYNDAFTIHEYPSSSTPPVARLKNSVKKLVSRKPDHRVFLNEFVRSSFGFNDGVPYSYRDMGVYEHWLQPLQTTKEYDFIYIGDLWYRGLMPVLEAFSNGAMKDHSLLVVSRDYEQVQQGYLQAKNISFAGPVTHEEVRTFISKSRYALNIMPDTEPFNRQTSTKLLEYCACKIPAVTSDYFWMREFEKRYGGKYFYLENELSNFSWKKVTQHAYEFPDLTEWTWEKQIERSGILQVLEKLR